MKKLIRIVAVIISALILMTVAVSCGGNSGDDLAMDLGGNLAKELTGAEVSNNNTWPDEMPATVPEMKNGTIVNSTGILVGGKINVTVSLENVSDDEFNDYVLEIEASDFNLVVNSSAGGIESKTFGQGENIFSVQFASKSGELIITYTGQ